jgi:nitrite reductase (NADH) small subunit/3-phenylpropionate/trans-cinnamate dioxygenase ferredoxin subunit
MALVKVANVDELGPGKATVVQAANKVLALFNLGGTFYALDNRCTHVGGPLGEGQVQENVVTCPWHGSRFDITSGQVVGPPARRPVVAYPVQVRDGDVFVEV